VSTTTLTLPPCAYATGSVQPPGSKSLANRALPLAAMAQGTTELFNLPDGEDVTLMREALRHLGVPCLSRHPTEENIAGPTGPWSPIGPTSGGSALPAQALGSPTDLFLGNSGTSMRILAAVLCGGHGAVTLDGIARMRERPIGDLVDALQALCDSTRIEYAGQPGFPPLRILAQGLKGGTTTIAGGVSSQFTTGLLLALPLCREPVTVEVKGRLVSAPYVAMTLEVMKVFGVTVENQDFKRFHCQPGQRYVSPGQYTIEPDASSASYFLAAGAIAGGKVQVTGLGRDSLQGEARFAEALARMGASVTYHANAIEAAPPASGRLRGIDIDMDLMSDTGMTLAIAALFAEGPTLIRGIGNWRVKETDRIDAMATELRKVGAEVESGPDWLRVAAPRQWQSAVIDTYNDHRMAMCFALTCLGGISPTLRDPGCVAKTYPGYFEALQSILRIGADAASPKPEWKRA
jgi:3-phosphoshikimate 1-carboxyvinyltransferase